MKVLTLTRLKDFVIVPYIVNGEWDGRHWVTLTDFRFSVDDSKFMIEAGFVTDFGSIPKSFRWLISPMGKGLIPFIVHDFLYRKPHAIGRLVADCVLCEMAELFELGKLRSFLVYLAVRSFGGPHYLKSYTMPVMISKGTLDAIVESHYYLKEKMA